MSSTIKIKRGTRQAITDLAIKGGLSEGEPLLITDEGRMAVATGANSFSTTVKQSDVVAFSASTTNSNVAGSDVVFNLVRQNTGAYNATNGRFTAPVDGWYQLNFHLMVQNTNPAGEYRLAFYVNGAGKDGYRYIYQKPSASSWFTMQGCGTMFLTNGQYVTVRFELGQAGAGIYNDAAYSNFSGFKIL